MQNVGKNMTGKEYIIFFKLITLQLGQELKLFYITETLLKLRFFSFKCIKIKRFKRKPKKEDARYVARKKIQYIFLQYLQLKHGNKFVKNDGGICGVKR
jgi:hypothetical protein